MYLEKWFTEFVKTECFLEIDFALLHRILSSSNLEITSEIEVFDAADAWIRHDTKERSKHAKRLLLQVRFPLLSDCALKHTLNKSSTFKQIEDCRVVIEDVLSEKRMFSQKSKSHFTNRFCTQPVQTASDEVLDGASVFYKGDVYTFYGASDKCTKTYENFYDSDDYSSDINDISYKIYDDNPPIIKYSPLVNKSVKWANWYDENIYHCYFCLCSFMEKIYLLGGFEEDTTGVCYSFDPKTRIWTKKQHMLLEKESASAVVFSGRIVVSGGKFWEDGEEIGEDELVPTTFVEVYDHISDSWSEFPSMNKRRANHKSFAIRNKLFVFGGHNTPEVYDSTCKKFVNLKVPTWINKNYFRYLYTMGSKIIMDSLFYDFEKDEWSEQTKEIPEILEEFKYF